MFVLLFLNKDFRGISLSKGCEVSISFLKKTKSMILDNIIMIKTIYKYLQLAPYLTSDEDITGASTAPSPWVIYPNVITLSLFSILLSNILVFACTHNEPRNVPIKKYII